MTLPAALQARLKKRGLIVKGKDLFNHYGVLNTKCPSHLRKLMFFCFVKGATVNNTFSQV